jgi:hypothetical protein
MMSDGLDIQQILIGKAAVAAVETDRIGRDQGLKPFHDAACMTGVRKRRQDLFGVFRIRNGTGRMTGGRGACRVLHVLSLLSVLVSYSER